jgi:hypothetical protein
MISCVVITESGASGAMGTKGGIKQGHLPVLSWKGENPMDELTVFMMANHTLGNWANHPFWLMSTW